MADEKKKPEAKPEPKGVAVVIYPLGGGRYRIASGEMTGDKLTEVRRVESKDSKRASLAFAETALEAIAAEVLK